MQKAALPRLLLRGITKQYPGVLANDSVDLLVERGEIHAILGENGAGKSTLMKIIYGSVQPDAGEIIFDGRPLPAHNPQMARKMGIAMVFQHFNLFETLTVAENIWLGQGKEVSREILRLNIEETSSIFNLNINPDRPIHTLSVGEMQRVEILRALLNRPKLLILDEPTSVLTPQAVQKLFNLLDKLASQGCSILYISHKLHEIQQICDRCTVMRHGKVVDVVDPRMHDNASLSRLMIGAEPAKLQERSQLPQAGQNSVLQVENLSLPSENMFGIDLQNISMQVQAGEIVGIAGISGNGQQEFLKALSGEDLRAAADSIRLKGQPIGKASAGLRRKRGLHFIPEERLGRGAVPNMDLAHNLLLTRKLTQGPLGFINRKVLHLKARDLIARFNVKASGTDATAKSLSGGNLQKFIVGREIDANPVLLLVSQPTWGVDVGAAAQIHRELINLREKGCAVLLISEELDEIFALSDRIYVIAKGRMSPPLSSQEATVDTIGAWMSGLWNKTGAEPLGAPVPASAALASTAPAPLMPPN